MRFVITIAGLALAASVIVPKFATQMHASAPSPAPAPSLMTARPAAALAASDSRSVVIPPSANGHFQVEGRVDGRRLNFMVDTGASVIALTERDAAMLGIHPAAQDYRAMVRTANGTVRAAAVELNMVEIEDVVVRNVPAMVLPDGALSDNLLGMSFLSRLHRWEFADGKLVLEQ